jgi:hypothetical protein
LVDFHHWLASGTNTSSARQDFASAIRSLCRNDDIAGRNGCRPTCDLLAQRIL